MGLVRRGVAIPKSLKDVCILDVLDGATEDKPLTQEEIRLRLADNYGIVVDRKTLHRRLELLMGSVERLRCREEARDGTDGVKTDFWMERDPLFEDSELRALTYLVVFSRHIPTAIKNEMLKKLDSMASGCLHHEMRNYIVPDGKGAKDYNELFLNIDLLSEAIAAKRKVSFGYTRYEDDKHTPSGESIITVSPLGIGVSGGDFYLLANSEGGEVSAYSFMASLELLISALEDHRHPLETFRIDRMKGIKILEEERRRLDNNGYDRFPGADSTSNRFDMLERIRENPCFLPGHSAHAELIITEGPRGGIDAAIDYFGKDQAHVYKLPKQDGKPDTYRITLKTNIEGLRRFALSNADSVEVVKPEHLRQELHNIFAVAAERTK